MLFELCDFNKPSSPVKTAELILDLFDGDYMDHNMDPNCPIKLFFELNDEHLELFGQNLENVPPLYISLLHYFYNVKYTDIEEFIRPQLYINKSEQKYIVGVEHYDNNVGNYCICIELTRKDMFDFIVFMDERYVPIYDILCNRFVIYRSKNARN